MTLSRPPTDDELLAWRDEANQDDPYLGPHQMLKGKLATTCDALLSERAAHLATKARLDRLAEAARHVIVGRVIDAYPNEPTWTSDEIRVAEALAALADPEEPHK